MIGQTISHYKITEKLGEGGMGVVYKGEDTKLDRPVALKFLAPHLLRGEEGRKRFEREAKAAARLDHPNICTIHEIDEAEGRTFIVMAFLEGRPLSEKIKEGPFKLSEALSVAIQTAEGLEAAHEKGITHRDIKPHNLMLMTGSRGLVKVMDFGLAQLAGGSKFTREGTMLGTMAYMSPEQAGGAETDSRTDIWSLGVVLYEMVAGQPPFRGDYDQVVVYSLMNEETEPLTGVRTGVPLELEFLVNKCLAKDMANRYQSAGELIVDLRNLEEKLKSGKSALLRTAAGQAGTDVNAASEDPACHAVPAAPTTSSVARESPSPNQSPGRKTGVKPALIYAVAAVLVVLVALFLFQGRDREGAVSSPTADTAAAPPSVAVMPFINSSGDPDFEYFSDGMTDELINALGKVKGLRVVGRSSVFRFKGQQYDSADVAERLQVGALLEGTVRRAGDRLRITAQLINAADGFELWSDRYDSEMKDVFDVQDEISRAMVGALSSELLGDSSQPIVRSSTDNPEAYRLYLQGRRFESSESGMRRRVALLEQALALDPDYPQAHAALADALAYLAILGFERPADVMERAREEALVALELDETISEAHTALGLVLGLFDWDSGGAERAYRRAVELNPADPMARAYYGAALANTGRFDEGISELRLALQSDPLSHSANLGLCYVLVDAGNFDAAVVQATRSLEIDPRWNLANIHIANAYLGLHRPADALRVSESAVAQAPRDPLMLGVLGRSQAAAGRESDARDTVEKLKRLRQDRYSLALPIAQVYASLGDLDRAFEWIDTAVEEREGLIGEINHPVIFAPLRKDPRYDPLVRRLGLPE